MIAINKIVIYMYFHKICMVRDFWDTMYNELYIGGKYELYVVDANLFTSASNSCFWYI